MAGTTRRDVLPTAERSDCDRLLGVLGHDLRNPLGSVSNSATYLQRTDGLTGDQAKAVSRILTSTSRMRQMVDDLCSTSPAHGWARRYPSPPARRTSTVVPPGSR